MLIFSTILSINDTLTKDAFIQLVIDWNQGSPHEANIIRGIEWHGERNIRYGDNRMWLDIQEYRNGNTIAVRYENIDDDGVVWDTDYVMNFTEMKISVLLYRSFLAEALTVDPKFSAPHFITLLAKAGYLKDDGDLPVTRFPVFIRDDNLSLVSSVVNGAKRYQLPVVYISKNYGQADPVDVKLLARRLKGVAHVFVQESRWTNNSLRIMCNDRNEYNGAVGIYFPNPAVQHKRYFYRAYQGYDDFLLEKVVRAVISYTNAQNIGPLYTWQGVINAMLRDRWSSRGEDLIVLERAKKSAEFAKELAEQERDEAEQQKDEAHQLVDMTDQEISDMKRQNEELTHENERLTAENAGLRTKLNGIDSMPVLYLGTEDEFFPGEIREMILAILDRALGDETKTRRSDVLRDIIHSNGYQHSRENRVREVKAKLKGYKTMNGALRRFLEDLGFVITEDGKHYRLTYYGDNRYHTTLAKSASDHREGENISTQIIRDML